MTINKAINGLSTLTERISLADDRQDAIAMGIKSLEAWVKLKEEINQLPGGVLRDSVYVSKVDLINLIDKCLSEVANDN